MPQDATIHDYAEYETKVRAEGIPKPELHWIKDGKQLKLDEDDIKVVFASASEVQVTSDLTIEHFSKKYQGNVSIFYLFLLILDLIKEEKKLYLFC